LLRQFRLGAANREPLCLHDCGQFQSESFCLGQTVKLVAKVVSSAPGGPTATVTFKQGATTLETATLSGGTATYHGDAKSAESSGTVSQTVK